MQKHWVIKKNGIKFFIMASSFAISADTLRYEFSRTRRIWIASIATGTPGVVTTVEPHKLADGDVVDIADNTGTTPDINGPQMITVTGEDTFEIDGVDITVAGTRGYVEKTDLAPDMILKSEVADILVDGTIDGTDESAPLVG